MSPWTIAGLSRQGLFSADWIPQKYQNFKINALFTTKLPSNWAEANLRGTYFLIPAASAFFASASKRVSGL